MTHAHIEAHEDHLVIQLDRMNSVGALRRNLVVPYSTIVDAAVGDPKWPTLLGQRRVTTFVPGVRALGAFTEWSGRRRFLDIGRDTRSALKLRLDGHPEFDEVEVDATDAESAVAEIGRHRADALQRPPVLE
ncbi:MAG: hypothetical protein WDA16_05005 [Candidatus Thermoplasmatota archaeon]